MKNRSGNQSNLVKKNLLVMLIFIVVLVVMSCVFIPFCLCVVVVDDGFSYTTRMRKTS